jgi:oxygen-dependent protoporphyrinogen oxidase
MTAAIIGGGVAGLTVAYELVKAGERPYLIEPGPIGGMIRSTQRDGFTLEGGPNVLVERPDLRYLLEELKLESSIAYPAVNPYGQYVWHNGRACKVPSGLWEFICSPLFGGLGKVLLPAKVLIPGILPRAKSDYSVLDFFSPLLGERTVRTLLDPVLKGIYGGDVSELSARAVFSNLWQAAREGKSIVGYMMSRPTKGKPPILVLQGGIQRLTDELWRAVEPYVNFIPRKAERVVPVDSKRFKILFHGGDQLEVDGCVVTAAAASAAPLVAHMSESLSDALVNVRLAGLTVVHLKVARSERLIPGAFGVLFPGGMPEDLLGVMFNSQIFPHMAPQKNHLLTVVLGGAQAGERVYDEAQLKARIPALLKQYLGIKDPQWLSMVQWPKAIPQLVVGHHALVAQLDQCEKQFPGVVFAGVDRGGVGVSDRIRIAREAVKRFRRVRVETVV